jgi:hypothetical protein
MDDRNWRVDEFQSAKCTQQAELMDVSRDNKIEAAMFSAFTKFKVNFW